jgi:hypothetical protein
LKNKAFDVIEIDEEELNEDDEITKEYKRLKELFEKNRAYFQPTNTVIQVDDDGVHHYDLSHACNVFNRPEWLMPADVKGKKISFVKEWFDDPTRRVVNKLVFKKPEDCKENEMTLFTGFNYTKLEDAIQVDEAVEFFKDLVMVGSGDEPGVAEYITKTFAHMIQNPFERPGVSIIFSSADQGTGKDTLMGIVSKIIGKKYTAHYIDTTQFWDRYDTNLEGAMFVWLEEACAGANKANSDRLKARITAEELMLNPKGLKAYSCPNMGRYFMTTNHADPVKLDDSDNRRFLICNPSNRLMRATWSEIYSKIFTPNWIYSVGKYLESINLDGWNPRTLPANNYTAFIKEESKSSELLFLQHWNIQNENTKEYYITPKELYQEYKSYCIENTLPYCQTTMSFTKRIARSKNSLYKHQRLNGGPDGSQYCPMKCEFPKKEEK